MRQKRKACSFFKLDGLKEVILIDCFESGVACSTVLLSLRLLYLCVETRNFMLLKIELRKIQLCLNPRIFFISAKLKFELKIEWGFFRGRLLTMLIVYWNLWGYVCPCINCFVHYLYFGTAKDYSLVQLRMEFSIRSMEAKLLHGCWLWIKIEGVWFLKPFIIRAVRYLYFH